MNEIAKDVAQNDSWYVVDAGSENVKMLAHNSTVFQDKENVVFLQEDNGSHSIGISLGGNQLIFHVTESKFGNNDDFDALKQSIQDVFQKKLNSSTQEFERINNHVHSSSS